MSAPYRLSRVVRTPSSEIYILWDGSDRVGRVDIHYGNDTVYATLILERDATTEEEEQILSMLDDDLISAYLPRYERSDFIANVFRGQEISRYTDASTDSDDDDDDDEEFFMDYPEDDGDDDDDVDSYQDDIFEDDRP